MIVQVSVFVTNKIREKKRHVMIETRLVTRRDGLKALEIILAMNRWLLYRQAGWRQCKQCGYCMVGKGHCRIIPSLDRIA